LVISTTFFHSPLQEYIQGKPNVSTFVVEFLNRKDADRVRQAAGSKGKNKGSGGGSSAAAGSGKGTASRGAAAVNEWQKAASGAQPAPSGAKKGGGGKQPAVKKVGGITATVPGFSLLSDRA
jgi:hypothetical protein